MPLLALVMFISPAMVEHSVSSWARSFGIALAALAGLVAAGRLAAESSVPRARLGERRAKVMTAAALLVVWGPRC